MGNQVQLEKIKHPSRHVLSVNHYVEVVAKFQPSFSSTRPTLPKKPHLMGHLAKHTWYYPWMNGTGLKPDLAHYYILMDSSNQLAAKNDTCSMHWRYSKRIDDIVDGRR